MSDNKHVQNDALWNKLSPATVAAGVTTRLPYNPTMGGGMPPTTVLFGGPIPSTTSNHGEINFSAARFQAPPIHQQHLGNQAVTATAASTLTQTMATVSAANFAHHHHTTPPSIVPSNVPVYPPTAAATSVLTPNPFAAVTGATTATTPAALQQLFHAMNSAAAASLANSTAMGSPLSLNTQTSPQVVAVSSPTVHTTHGSRMSVTAPDLPSPSSNSSAGVMPSTSGFLSGGGGSGAITSTITENVLSAISGLAQHATPARNMGFGVKYAPDEEKLRRVHQMVEASVSDHAKQQIVQILDCISTLKPVEKLLLYLRLPGAAPETDPLRQPQNPLGTRSEINHTINWVRSHLEQDSNVSIPKQDVYNDYIAYCERLDIKPLSTADFGKVMKQVFPGIRPRRLGTRGHSRYCYAAMRKTTKLASPQLPNLGAGTSREAENSAVDQLSSGAAELGDQNSETWSVIKTWAENMLQVKLENADDLATIIKGTPASADGVSTATGRTNITHKKFGNRETKEKRLLTDMGPLKKRRKKKRKGSSSSESSFGSQPPNKQNSNDKAPVQPSATVNSKTTTPTTQIEPIKTATTSEHHKATPKVEDEAMKLVEVKEEFIELPNNQQHLQHLSPPSRHVAALGDNYMQHQQQQPQMLPINLAPEQRTVLTRAPSAASAFNSALSSHRLHAAYGAAAKNLVPKIMELAAANPMNDTVANTSQGTGFSAVNQSNRTVVPLIKEEETDEYNTANILCKKVRKAQQTKGVWQQHAATTATSVTHIVPVITTSAATPTPQHQDTPTTSAAAANTPSPNYLMGPPAAASSTSPFDTSVTGHLTPTPKVASRNMAQLRAKRLQLAAAAAAAQAAADDDLPESLGLPRERVISICNMDKHELDDYLINGEEEEDNSNEQDTELLQYFQTGDAEEKLNSSDAGKQRNPTTAAAVAAATQISGGQNATLQQRGTQAAANAATSTVASTVLSVLTGTVPTSTTATTTTTARLTANTTVVNATATLAKVITTTAPVGSASASLAFMSQKHQQQQALQQQQIAQQKQFQIQNNNIAPTTATKRKIPPSVTTVKHCTFAPISPNINNTNSSLSHTAPNGAGSAPLASAGNGTASNAGLFASPGLTPPTRLRPKPAFGKQQSLDIDMASSLSFPASSALSSMHDPMIGATRRRRNYASVTSASAPPSPSILHQQQQQQLFSAQHFQNAANQWQSLLSASSTSASAVASSSAVHSAAATSFLNDQNSLDLDLFGAANAATHTNNNAGHYGAGLDVAGAFSFDEYVTETQRSQSVPLSQLQRIHSPPAHRNIVNASNRAIGDFNVAENSLMCSENSSSQHSNSTATTAANIIKLEDAATATAEVIAASDSAALLDGVDVSEILSSPDFVQNFTSIAAQQGNVALATTTCSSAGSSSGYSSGACTTFSGSGNIMSRSVPSTPLPHHHQNLFGQSSINFYNQRRRSGLVNDELQLSPGGNGYAGANIAGNKFNLNNSNINSTGGHNNNINNANNGSGCSFGNTFGSRSVYDISKSMPTTPITTPCFRYSPEFNRDFLINGNTIDDSIGFGTVGGSDSLMGGGTAGGVSVTGSNVIVAGVSAHDDESVNLASNLNADALLSTDDVSVPGAEDVLLGNL